MRGFSSRDALCAPAARDRLDARHARLDIALARRFRGRTSARGAGAPFSPLIAKIPRFGPQFAAMLALAGTQSRRAARREDGAQPTPPTSGGRRVALLTGCAQAVLAPQINAATKRLLNRAGVSVALAPGEGCCGSLLHHMGRETRARDQMRANVDVWSKLIDEGGLEAIVVTASGCGATIKDYGALLADDPAFAAKAARISALARDVSEYVAGLDIAYAAPRPLIVAYHAACTLQHGQRIVEPPKALLTRAGFRVRSPAEAHLCCGSAGTYNILQPEMAAALGARKTANLVRLKPDVIAAGNIGCLTQIASASALPVVHTVELLDWASGGPPPLGLGQTVPIRATPPLIAVTPPIGQTARASGRRCAHPDFRARRRDSFLSKDVP